MRKPSTLQAFVAVVTAVLLAVSLFPAQALAAGEDMSSTARIAATAPAGNNQYVTGGVVYRGVDNQPGDVAAVGFADELKAPGDAAGENGEPAASGEGAEAGAPEAAPEAAEAASDAAAAPATPQTSISIPATIRTAKGECRVVGIAFDEGQTAPGVTAMSIGSGVEEIHTATLGAALPNLASITVDTANKAYASYQGILYKQAELSLGAGQPTKKVAHHSLIYAPARTVAVNINTECRRVEAGAFLDAAALETIVVWGPVDTIAGTPAEEGGEDVPASAKAFTDQQTATAAVAIMVAVDDLRAEEGADRISSTVALAPGGSTDCTSVWKHAGFPYESMVRGASAGDDSLTAEKSRIFKTEADNDASDAAAAPDAAEPEASESGLVYTMQTDGMLAAAWKGDVTATPAAIELPATARLGGIAYPVGSVAAEGFKGAPFLTEVVLPVGVTAIGASAFEDCANLKTVTFPATLKSVDYAAFNNTALEGAALPKGVTIGGQNDVLAAQSADAGTLTTTATDQPFDYDTDAVHGTLPLTGAGAEASVPDAQPTQYTGATADLDSAIVFDSVAQPQATTEDEDSPYANNLFAYAVSATVPTSIMFAGETNGYDFKTTTSYVANIELTTPATGYTWLKGIYLGCRFNEVWFENLYGLPFKDISNLPFLRIENTGDGTDSEVLEWTIGEAASYTTKNFAEPVGFHNNWPCYLRIELLGTAHHTFKPNAWFADSDELAQGYSNLGRIEYELSATKS